MKVNNLLSDVEKFFQECWNPIKDEEEIKDSLEIDGKLALCIPCHNQIFPHCYELCNDLPNSYSETIFSPLTIGNEWNALEDNNVDYFAPDVKIDVKQEFNDSSVVKKTKKTVRGKTGNKKEYICDLCGKVFKLNDSLKNHVRVKHEQKKIFKCRQCKKSFSYQTGLREHRGVCKGPSKEKRWIYWGKHSHRPKCIHPDCVGKEEVKFTVQSILIHVLDVHTSPENSEIQCPDCPMKFPMKVVLKFHREQEHGAKAKVCTICGTTIHGRLDMHMKSMHNTEKKFQCDKCDYRCKLKHQLTRHLQIHDDPDDRKHKCEICGKGFIATQKLREHILTHTNIKPYKCELCNQAFSNFSGHRQHMMKKHGLKFTCDICGQDSSSMRGLSIHKRDKHSVPA